MSSEAGSSGLSERIDHYRIVRRLALGGMAEIFEAVDERSGRTVALKKILPHIATDPDFLDRFFHEIRIQISLKHPNIVELLDCSPDAGARLHRHGIRRRRRAERPPQTVRPLPVGDRALRHAGGPRRARGRSREGRHPPRHQAAEHHVDARGVREDRRLRDQPRRAPHAAHAHGHRRRHARPHVARAGAGRGAGRRGPTSSRWGPSSTSSSAGTTRSRPTRSRRPSAASRTSSPSCPRFSTRRFLLPSTRSSESCMRRTVRGALSSANAACDALEALFAKESVTRPGVLFRTFLENPAAFVAARNRRLAKESNAVAGTPPRGRERAPRGSALGGVPDGRLHAGRPRRADAPAHRRVARRAARKAPRQRAHPRARGGAQEGPRQPRPPPAAREALPPRARLPATSCASSGSCRPSRRPTRTRRGRSPPFSRPASRRPDSRRVRCLSARAERRARSRSSRATRRAARA